MEHRTKQNGSGVITADQIIAEIIRLTNRQDAKDNGMTKREMCKALGFKDGKTAEMLREAIAAGKLECRRAKRMNVLGELVLVPAYFPVTKSTGK